jgi:hypothetical protein
MENAGNLTFHKTMERRISNANDKITLQILRQTCAIIYQISMLLSLLQKKLQFVHRDLHTGNIMLSSLTTQTNECGDHLYEVYLIDFGFSRATINGNVYHSMSYFTKPTFSPRFDMTLLMFDIFYYTFRCRIKNNVQCTRDLPKNVLKLWEKILKSTGIKYSALYKHDDTVDRGDLYDTIMEHHQKKRELTSISYIQKQIKLLIHELCIEQENINN